MAIQVTGKNLDLGTALRGYIAERLDKAFDKYGTDGLSGHVFIEKEHGQFTTTCTVHLRSGLSLQSQGAAGDAYPSVDEAMDRLSKQLRRYKRRLKNHHQAAHQRNGAEELSAIDYTILPEQEDDDENESDLSPVIIAEMPMAIGEFSVGDAAMQMDLADKPFLVFKNASHGRLNVVYRRDDGNIGWVDPGGIVSSQKAE